MEACIYSDGRILKSINLYALEYYLLWACGIYTTESLVAHRVVYDVRVLDGKGTHRSVIQGIDVI